ncbi:ScbR family autoregulator-binding transcription factor [Streptomyces sp. NPDC005925]|uniref:ScbR family autoregulator-binding transcription factor n=1 Tax=Streptomyces sp. NPDC005925 TaxID=3157172 RepID=UPI0033E3D268
MRTRRQILDAAGVLFAVLGYKTATVVDLLAHSGVTKGAFYFHFSSKEDVARALFKEQSMEQDLVAPQKFKLQEIVDGHLVLTSKLRNGARERGCFRLCLEQGLDEELRRSWLLERVVFNQKLLTAAREQGELAAHVSVRETAEFLVSACMGLQLMSQTVIDDADTGMGRRIALLLRNVMSVIAIPDVYAELDIRQDRGIQLLET